MKWKLVSLSGGDTQYVNGYQNACNVARSIAREQDTEVIVSDPEERTIVLSAHGHRPATVDEVGALRSGKLGDWSPTFSPWRHGGWYVDNVRYPSGAVGCVSRNYEDRKWRIVCDPREGSYPGGPNDHTYPSREAAARAERDLIQTAAACATD